MQKIVDFEQICDLYIKEDKTVDIDALLTEWFVGVGKEVYEQLMKEEDEAARNEIEQDQQEIEGEEFFGEDELGGEEGGEEAATGDLDATLDGGDGAGEGEDVTLQDLASDFEKLKAEFDALLSQEVGEPEHAGLESEIGRDVDGDGDISGEGEGEEVAVGGEEEVASAEGEDEGEEVKEAKEEEEEVEEAFNLDEFLDLEESFNLESVPNPKVAGNKEIADGGTFTVNDKSPVVSKKGTDRAFAGKPVEVKSTQHKGYERETAPAVKQQTLLKNQVKNSKDSLEPVKQGGDKGALLNSGEGFGKENVVSPIGSGATDLRGKGK
jgi:hypothetical protein